MLNEVPHVRQIEGEPLRRWFADEELDLIVWFEPEGAICGFQLCYGDSGARHALTWLAPGGYFHHRLDDGDWRIGRTKAATVLADPCPFDPDRLAARFLEAASALESSIADFVLEKIRGHRS